MGNKYVDVLFWPLPLSSFSCTHQTSITHTSHVINCDVAHGFVFCFCLVLDSVKINKACRIKSNQVESSRIKSSIRAFGAHLRTAEHEARTAVRWGIAAAKTTDKVSSAQSGHTREQKAFLPKPPPIPSRPLALPRAPSRSLALPCAPLAPPSRSLRVPSRPLALGQNLCNSYETAVRRLFHVVCGDPCRQPPMQPPPAAASRRHGHFVQLEPRFASGVLVCRALSRLGRLCQNAR